MEQGRVIVLGSTNTDLVVRTERFPRPGETVIGSDFLRAHGGKGANQAVAAARAGASVTLVSAVGNDEFGNAALIALRKDGIDVSHVARVEAPTGVALITVDEQGENCIVVAPGANAHVASADVDRMAPVFRNARIVLTQLEIPLDTVIHSAQVARTHNVRFLLNPAPAQPLPDELLENTYCITPNATEAELLTGLLPVDPESAAEAGRRLIDRGPEAALITLGAEGAVLVTSAGSRRFPAPRVDAVDTTAAGDAFNGALACALAEGADWSAAIPFAAAAGALAVTANGAQPSIPVRKAIEALISS